VETRDEGRIDASPRPRADRGRGARARARRRERVRIEAVRGARRLTMGVRSIVVSMMMIGMRR